MCVWVWVCACVRLSICEMQKQVGQWQYLDESDYCFGEEWYVIVNDIFCIQMYILHELCFVMCSSLYFYLFFV